MLDWARPSSHTAREKVDANIRIAVMLVVLIPLAVIKPWTGVLTWTWISIMNPHKLTFGFL